MKKTAPKTPKNTRPSWDEYFMGMVTYVGTRSTCDRGKSGCVIVRDKRIVSTGYIGSPSGLPHCDDVGHEMHSVIHEDGIQTQHCIRTAHAEQNAIAQAARFGTALDGATLYCHMTPCYICAKSIIAAGITKVICDKDYHASKRSKEIFKQAGVTLTLIHNEVEIYKNM